MLETVCLLFLIDLSLKLSVDSSCFPFLLIVKPVLNHFAQMMQETDRTKRRRPIAVGPDAVQKLLGIGIPMLCGKGQVGNGFLIIPLDFFAIEIDFPELVLCIVISILGGYLEVSNCPENIFYLGFGEENLSDEICGVGILELDANIVAVFIRKGDLMRGLSDAYGPELFIHVIDAAGKVQHKGAAVTAFNYCVDFHAHIPPMSMPSSSDSNSSRNSYKVLSLSK